MKEALATQSLLLIIARIKDFENIIFIISKPLATSIHENIKTFERNFE